MKIKVVYNCDSENIEVMSIKTFINKFNNEEINSATDIIELVPENKEQTNEK